MGKNKSSGVRWVLCPVNVATTVASDGRQGSIRSLIIHRTTGSAIGTCVITDSKGDTLLNLQSDSDISEQLDLWDLPYQGLIVTNSTAIQVWVAVTHESPIAAALPHPDMVE